MSAGLWGALRKRYAAPEYAWFEEMRNGTGFSRKQDRTADAMAFGTWPSRGLHLHGFEVKVSRSDWLREKKQPEKSVELQRFCDFWWLVTTEGCVTDIAEVPLTWGWMEWNGKKLVTKREAPMLEAQPLDRPMLAAILRRAADLELSKVEELATEKAKERHEAEVANHLEVVSRLNASIDKAHAENNNLTSLLNAIAGACGVQWTESRPSEWGKHPAKEWPAEALAKFEAFRLADLDLVRHHASVAYGELRRAASTARLALHKLGVRGAHKRRYS